VPARAVDVLVVEQPEAHDIETGVPSIGQAESEAVAQRVQALLESEHCEPKDIAILTPVLTHSGALQAALARRQIDSYLVRGKGYYSRDEVSDVRALLQVLVNPHDDLSLVTVLRSPLVGLSDDALYLVGRAPHRGRRSNRDRLSLWDTVCQGVPDEVEAQDRAALQGLVAKMAKLAARVGRPGLASLIDDAVSDFTYDLCVLASEEGDRRFANIRKLMRLADEHESLHGPDLAGFVGVVNEMGDLSDAEGSAPTLAEGENVVRIMTVHQAKGLEFPVVVLTGLGAPMRRDDPPQFIVANDGRAGIFFRGTKNGTYESHDLSSGSAVEIREESRAQEQQEDLRLLYVAMTRAKERLVLVGARPRRSEKLDGCHIGWIVSALGFETFPESGQVIEIEGLSAVLASVVPSSTASSLASAVVDEGQPVRSPGAELGLRGVGGVIGLGAGGDGGETCPRFLELGPPVVLPRRLSFSALSEFQKCPRRFYLERVVGLRLGESVDHLEHPLSAFADDGAESEDLLGESRIFLDEGETNVGRDVGLLVHALLERLPLSAPVPDLSLLRDMAAQIEADGGASLAEAHIERAFALTRAFWLTPFSSRPGLAGAGKEVSFCFAREGVVLSGVMDLVWQEGDSWFIADYKTNALLGRSPEEVAAGYDLQSCVYCLAALYAGARQVSMEFLFLEQPEAPVGLAFSPGDVAVLEAKLDAVLAEIEKGDFPSMRGVACEGCTLGDVCFGLH
jgi:ATP-dependent helicase/nuclease subunit A